MFLSITGVRYYGNGLEMARDVREYARELHRYGDVVRIGVYTRDIPGYADGSRDLKPSDLAKLADALERAGTEVSK